MKVRPVRVYPVKEDHVYAICQCELPMEYGLDLGPKKKDKIVYSFECVRCKTKGLVYCGGYNER